jgi:hypothetical protein
MALSDCPDCGNPLSDEADSCPKCGRVMRRPGRRVAAIAAGLLFVAVATVGARSAVARHHAADVAALRWTITPTEACEETVRKKLVDPASARFPRPPEVLVGGQGERFPYTISGRVMAGAGGLASFLYQCSVRPESSSGTWDVISKRSSIAP